MKENINSSTDVTKFIVYPATVMDCVIKMKTPITRKIKDCITKILELDMSLKKDLSKYSKKKPNDKEHQMKPKAEFSVIAYPKSDMNDVLMIMESLNLDSIPIVKNPWNKEIIGYMDKKTLIDELGCEKQES